MASSFFQAVLSFFKPRPKMTSAEKILLHPDHANQTDIFLYVLTSWASGCKDPKAITDRFQVVTLMHIKSRETPQHEFVLLETKDRDNVNDDEVQFFILERNVDLESTVTTNQDPALALSQLFEAFKRLARAGLGSSLASMEEGTTSMKMMGFGDELSVCTMETANSIMESLRKAHKNMAVDHFKFMGCDRTFPKHYHGQIVQYFRPKSMSLFQFAVLAHVVHEAYPSYSILNSQCYFYAALVYAAAEGCFEVLAVESADPSQTGLVSIRGSHLSDQYGRWNGVKITNVNPDSAVVHAIIDRFKTELRSSLNEVCFLVIFQITIAYNIQCSLHRLIKHSQRLIKRRRTSKNWRISGRSSFQFRRESR
jgi:hypothetical protein